MKKRDVILLLCILGISAVLLGIFYINSHGTADVAVITVDGEEYARLPLDEDTRIDIDTEYGKNTVVISDGKAFVEWADCPDGVCVRTGEASEMRSVVCLPHKLTVTLEKGNGQ